MTYLDEMTVVYDVKCIWCGEHYFIRVSKEDAERYEAGEGTIQNVFPMLSADERELLISQVCSKCFLKEM